MPNPNLFQFTINGKTCYADPLKVRRDLLSGTMGKCWGIIREITKTQKQVEEARANWETLQKDLEESPTTQEEMTKLAEIQKSAAENKQHTFAFNDLPRVMKADGYSNQIALFSNKIAELEGVLANAAFQAFDLPPINLETGEGVTELEAISTLKLFVEYAEGKGERLGS